MTKVSIVIVNYNGVKYLKDCVNSILKSNYGNFEIIVVDNGSDDGSHLFIDQMARQSSRKITLVKNKTNLGLTIARNQGIRESHGELIAFLDNDTYVDKDWLVEAIRIFDRESTIGGCQCKLLFDPQTKMIDSCGEYLSQFGFLVNVANQGFDIDDGKFDSQIELLSAKGAGMILRKSAIEKAGFFDEDYFIYVDETDICWRIWLSGYKIVLAPKSIVYHVSGTSSIIMPDEINYLVKFHGTKNYIATLIKNLGFKSLCLILPIHVILWLGISCYFLSLRQFKSFKLVFQGIFWNFWNLGKLLHKRKLIQSRRKISDGDLFKLILKIKNLKYFLDKLTDNRKIGNVAGWDKGE